MSVVAASRQFGIGIGLFFHLTAGYTMLLVAQFCVLLPSVFLYMQPKYSGDQAGVAPWLRGSAVCTRKRQVVVYDRATGLNVTATQHMCPLIKSSGMVTMASILTMALLMALFWRHIWQRVEEIDEGVQSAQDYSVLVTDPDPDARDTQVCLMSCLHP